MEREWRGVGDKIESVYCLGARRYGKEFNFTLIREWGSQQINNASSKKRHLPRSSDERRDDHYTSRRDSSHLLLCACQSPIIRVKWSARKEGANL
jgi:hypothetical protein